MLALILTLFSLLILPLTKLEAQSAPFIVLCLVSLGFALSSSVRQISTKPSVMILGFLAVCMANALWVVAGRVTVEEYIRGIIPFLFLTFYFVTVRIATLRNFDRLYVAIIVLGMAYATENVILLPKVISGEVWRSTFVNANHSVPLPVVGFHFCLGLALRKETSTASRVGLMLCAAYMLLSSMLTGTRSLIIASLLPLLLIPLTQAPSVRKLLRYVFAVALLGVIFLVAPTQTFLKGARIGYTQAGSIDTRMQENQVALDLIQSSPVIGQGLGFRFATAGLYYQVTRVGYVHNSYLYILMDFGIFGLLYIGAPLVAIFTLRPAQLGPHRDHAIGIVLAISGIMIFSAGFAMARLIHFNLLLGVLIGMAEVLKRDYALAARAIRGPVFVMSRTPFASSPVLPASR